MAAKRNCKICGKEYDYCHTNRPTNPFRWQDVACCPEHGSEYFALIIESRKPKNVENQKSEEEIKEPFYSPEDDEIDEEEDEEDDFNDDDE